MVLGQGSRAFAPSTVAVYRRLNGTWALEQQIDSPDGSITFGFRVAIDDQRLFILDAGDGDIPGAVYVFESEDGSWQQTARISLSITSNYLLRVSMDVSGPNLILGLDNRAEIFRHHGGNEWKRLELIGRPSGLVEPGNAVAMSDDIAMFLTEGSTRGLIEVWEYDSGVWGFVRTLFARSNDGMVLEGQDLVIFGNNLDPQFRRREGDNWIIQVLDPLPYEVSMAAFDYPLVVLSGGHRRLLVLRHDAAAQRWRIQDEIRSYDFDDGIAHTGTSIAFARSQAVVATVGADDAVITTEYACVACPVDFDQDSVYSTNDVQLFVDLFRFNVDLADLDGNGVINFFDIAVFLSEYANGCG